MLLARFLSVGFAAALALPACDLNGDGDPTSTSSTDLPATPAEPPQAFPAGAGTTHTGYYRGSHITYQRIDGKNVFQGDIVIDDEQVSQIPPSESRAKIRSAVLTSFLWPNSAVYYTIDSTLPNPQRVKDAITHVQQKTNVTFWPRNNNEANYIRFTTDPSLCLSTLGMTKGAQISLADSCTTGSTIHEIGHSLNLFHEQSRADRDKTIVIKWDNIDKKWVSQFKVFPEGFGANVGAYDLNSIMHYPCYISSMAIDPNKPVITKTDGSTWVGQRTGLSQGDIDGINYNYPPIRPQERGNALRANEFLLNGEYLLSSNGMYLLYMQRDGNLVLYSSRNGTRTSIWNAGTYGKPVLYALFQSDGNFVLYDIDWKSHWNSGSSGNPGAYVVLQDDGNMVCYDSAQRFLWHTNTRGR